MRHHTLVNGLRYFGGKAAKSRNRWVAGLLPWAKTDTYVEPFGGMMSVLLYRAQADCEIYNDLNGDVVNWWRCIQMARTEFLERVEATPHSRAELEKARRVLLEPFTLTDEPDLARGHAVYALLMNSQLAIVSPSQAGKSFRLAFSLPGSSGLNLWEQKRLLDLSSRIQKVQLLHSDAATLLNRYIDQPHLVAYIDPPYAQSVTGGTDYDFTCDYNALTDVLLRMQGSIAVSGYGTEWDHLDWVRYEKKDAFTGMSKGTQGTYSERTEVLWCNYDARKEGSAFWDSMSISDRFEEKAERWD